MAITANNYSNIFYYNCTNKYRINYLNFKIVYYSNIIALVLVKKFTVWKINSPSKRETSFIKVITFCLAVIESNEIEYNGTEMEVLG